MGESWLRINLLCLMGASLGSVSLFFAWVQPWAHPDYVAELLGQTAFRHNILYAYPTILVFVIGSMVALVSPLGGIVQASAFVGHIAYLVTDPPLYPIPAVDMISEMPGAWLGGLAAAITLSGLLWRVALETRVRKPQLLKRVLTITSGRETVGRKEDAGPRPGILAGRTIMLDRVNLFAVAGSLIGISSVTFAWLAGEWPFLPSEDMGSLILGAPRWEFIPEATYIAGVVFLAGSILSLATYLGAVVQLGGLVLFLAIVRNSLGEYTMNGYFEPYTAEISLGAGFFVGIASVVIVCCSYAFRDRIGKLMPRASGSGRLFVWSKASVKSISHAGPASNPRLPVQTLNVLCLLGFVVGIISLLGAWWISGPSYLRELYVGNGDISAEPMCSVRVPTVASVDLIGMVQYHLVGQVGFVIFLVGLAMSFSSQVGGGLQLVGLSLLGYLMFDEYDAYSTGSMIGVLGPGYFLGIASAVLVITSSFIRVQWSWDTSAIHRFGRYLMMSEIGNSAVNRSAAPSRFRLATGERWSFALDPRMIVVVASIAALISLFLPWAIDDYGATSPWESLMSYQRERYGGLSAIPPVVPIILFMLGGSLLALFTPIGGFLQAFSVSWFFWEYVRLGEFQLGYGYIVAIASAGLTLASLTVTVYRNRSARAPLFRNSLLTWSVRERGSSAQAKM